MWKRRKDGLQFIWARICPVSWCVCVDLTYCFLFLLIVGTKQTSALKQEDASKRYENYSDSCFQLSVNHILIEPFLKTIMGATSEKIILREGEDLGSTINSRIDCYFPYSTP